MAVMVSKSSPFSRLLFVCALVSAVLLSSTVNLTAGSVTRHSFPDFPSLSPVQRFHGECLPYDDSLSFDFSKGYSKEHKIGDFRKIKNQYFDYLNRPKNPGFVDELLGPVHKAKNGPYALWHTRLARLSVVGCPKFQNQSFMKRTLRMFPSCHDSYDFYLHVRTRSYSTFRLSGTYAMDALRLERSAKTSHLYRVNFHPEYVVGGRWIFGDDSSLSLAALFGPEVGLHFSLDDSKLKSGFYLGATAALRLDYNIGGCLSLFVEPRLCYAPYSFRVVSGYNSYIRHGNLYGRLTRLACGFRLTF